MCCINNNWELISDWIVLVSVFDFLKYTDLEIMDIVINPKI